ncbi:hypothetical protein COY95_03850 [Candidatus Woesearchaeota archaeon CG_4_10_14_0_8_um_filter_47_5]|nr:MAG: hypothetical protein COY95_03850 [Candidatus Woesearchaeota archaeon CG_4_10_14_0_8_um_filter_47_5]
MLPVKTKPWAIALVVFCTILTATGQILYKKAAATLSLTIPGLVTNQYLILGIVVYLFSAALLVIALRNGELSVLYPFIATSFVWVNMASSYFFGESLNTFKWAGVAWIIVGVSFIGKGSVAQGKEKRKQKRTGTGERD